MPVPQLPPTRFEMRYIPSKGRELEYVTVYIDQFTQPEKPWSDYRAGVERQMLLDGTNPDDMAEALENLDNRYKRWKEAHSDDLIVEGMPLRDWPAINRHQLEELRNAYILSVEQLAETPDSKLERVGASFIGLKRLAQNYLKDKESVDRARRVENLEHQIEQQGAAKDEQIAQLQAQLSALTSQLQVTQEPAPPAPVPTSTAPAIEPAADVVRSRPAPPRRKPGRPPKRAA